MLRIDLPPLRIDPLARAIVLTLIAISVVAGCMAAGLHSEHPNPGLMYALAQVGVALVLGFLLEAVWLVERIDRDQRDHRDWLGTMTGCAVGGLIGVAVALAVGAHRSAGHANLLDAFGLWWSIFSLALLSSIVVIQPLMADALRSGAEAKPR